jgi:thiosulfate/3-mercaptopyruvate sulfurtransferase
METKMNSRPGLITADELATRLDAGDSLVAVDLRQDAGDGKAKIPGSAWISLHDGFAQIRPNQNLSYDLPSAEEFAAAMAKLGVTPGTHVVFADDMLNRWSTRAFWVLKYYRHEGEAQVLDGGINAYLATGRRTEPGFVTPRPAEYPVPTATDESIRITPDEIVAGIATDSLTLYDVRTPGEFSGEVEMSGRGGHIPGAINITWESCLDADGRFLPDDRLGEVLRPYMDDLREPVTYCQGGIRASLTWFALQVLLGRKARLYAASWEEWAQDPALPAVR